MKANSSSTHTVYPTGSPTSGSRYPIIWTPWLSSRRALPTHGAAAAWGEVAGRWHDLGKYSAAFQAYLHKENGFEAHLEQYKGRVDHSTVGAQYAEEQLKPWGGF